LALLPAKYDWFATIRRVPSNATPEGESNGTDEVFVPVNCCPKRAISVPDGLSSTIWLEAPTSAR
jgi:hypothetical protein